MVAINAAQAVVSGQVRVPFTAHDEAPGVAALTARVDGELALTQEGDAWLLDVSGLAEGPHVLQMTAMDGSVFGNTAVVDWSFIADNTPPELTVTTVGGGQGRTLAAFVSASEPLRDVSGELDGEALTSAALEPETHRLLTGIGLEADVGPRMLVVRALDIAGNEQVVQTEVAVLAVAYPSGGLIQLTDAQRQARKDDSARVQATEERKTAYAAATGQPTWQGPFRMPAAGQRTSPFGKFRTYSDGKKQLHTGLDVGAPTGTAVHAAAGGRVLLAREQAIYGNVVIVGHGQGVSTSYNHLSRIDVAEGDVVEIGERVGAVGSTGQSTGPHLHWGLVVGGVAVDPDEWLNSGFMGP